MHFGVPIAAYGCCAIPETLGNGGILLDSKEPEIAAAAANRVIRDGKLRAAILEGQKEMLKKYAYETVKEKLLGLMKEHLINS